MLVYMCVTWPSLIPGTRAEEVLMQSGNVAGVRIVPQFLGRKILMSSGRPLDPVSCECV